MKKITCAVIGDCCVDKYKEEKKSFLGGTAFNVAYAATDAGASVSLISSVGRDVYGKKYLEVCRNSGIDTAYLSVREGTTSSIDIFLDKDKSPQFRNWDLGVLQRRRLTQEEKSFLVTQDIVRAVLFKPVAAMFETFSTLNLPNTIKVGDFLGTSIYSYRTSPLDTYAPRLDILIKSVEVDRKDSLAFLQHIAKKYNTIVVALMGSNGSIVFDSSHTYTHSAINVKVVNTTGAGDAYQAYFCYWYAKTKNIPRAMDEATKAATRTITHLASSYPKSIV